MAKLLGLRSASTAWVGDTGEHQHRAYLNWCQSLLAGSLEEKVLSLLLY